MKRSALTRRTPLARGEGPKRRAPLRAVAPAKPRARDHAASDRWYAALAQQCQHPACLGQRGRLHLHHVTYSQCVVREGGDQWDPRNALTLCDGCHAAHHNRSRPLSLHTLPDSAFAFAADLLGAGRAYEYLRRRYAGSDVRLARMLDATERRAAA